MIMKAITEWAEEERRKEKEIRRRRELADKKRNAEKILFKLRAKAKRCLEAEKDTDAFEPQPKKIEKTRSGRVVQKVRKTDMYYYQI